MFWILRHKVSLILFFLFSAVVSYAQNNVTIKANVDKDSIVIGEQIHFHLEADFPIQEPMRFFTIDSIAHFEILDRQKVDTVDDKKEIKLSQNFTLTSFDSGHWVIPSFELPGDKPLFTDSIPVDVRFTPFDPNQDYHGIKDIIEVHAAEKKKQNWYGYVAVSALLLAAIIYLLTKKKKKHPVNAPPVDAYEEAKQDLAKLPEENLSSKLFYTRLIDIFRLYISRRKGIDSLQKTTDDLVLQLRSLKLPADEFNRLAQALRMSDFVKFAKYEPHEKDKEDSFSIIKSSVDLIEKSERDIRKNSNYTV